MLNSYPSLKEGKLDINTAFELMRNKHLISPEGYGTMFAKTLAIPVDKQKVIESGVVDEKDYDKIVDTVFIKLRGNQILKSDLMVLEMLRNNDWSRPLYFCLTVGNDYYPDIQQYLQGEGMAYRFVPVLKKRNVSTEKMYVNVMEKYKYGNISDPNIYLDETNRRMCSTLRQVFAELVRSLVAENQYDKARLAIERCEKEIPLTAIPADYTLFVFADAYFKMGDKQKAEAELAELVKNSVQNLDYVLSLPIEKQGYVSRDLSLRENLGSLQQAMYLTQDNQSELFAEYSKLFEDYYRIVAPRLQQ
jgi:tetratricopeptide (TPR) repeat protein